MARIPLYEQQVGMAGRAAPMPQNVGPQGLEAISRGASQLGQAVGNQLEKAAQEYDKRAEESRKKALEAEVTEAETDWTRYRTEKKYGRRSSGSASQDAGDAAFDGEDVEQPGYFNLKGDDAFKAAPDTVDSIEKRRGELANGMADDEAKELFLKRTAPHLEDDRAQVFSFAGKQRIVADQATLQAREAAALEAIRANPNDWVETTKQIAALEQPIAKLGLSDVDKQARVDDWRRRAGVAQVVAQLNSRDWQSAEKTLESKRATIGEEAAAKLNEDIRRLKAGAGAEGAASAIAAAAMDPETGRINEGKALQLLEQTPEEQRKEVAARLDHKILETEKAWTQRVSFSYSSAFTTYLQTKDLDQVRPQTKQWLIDHAPEKWDELEQKQNRDRDRAKRLLRGERDEGQTHAERLALVELQADLVRNPDKYANMTPQQFDLEWGAKLSPSGYKIGGAAYANAAKGDRLSDAEFSAYVNELAKSTPQLNTTDKRQVGAKKALRDGFLADFGEARRAFKDEFKRNPTMTEVQGAEFQKQIFLNLLKRSGVPSSALESTMQLPELDFSGSGPPAKKVVKYKRNREGTKRVPVYDDGSFGPEEPVR